MTAAVAAAVRALRRGLRQRRHRQRTIPTTMAAADLDAHREAHRGRPARRGCARSSPRCRRSSATAATSLKTASVYAFFNGVVSSAYASSKAAVALFGRSLRGRARVRGRVPPQDTLPRLGRDAPIAESAHGGNKTVTQLKERAFRGPLGTYIEPEQIANAVVAGHRHAPPDHRAQALEPAFRDARSDQHPRRPTPRTRPREPGTNEAGRRRRGAPAPSRAQRPLLRQRRKTGQPDGESLADMRQLTALDAQFLALNQHKTTLGTCHR